MSPKNINALRTNIAEAILGMKREGTIGASVACLKQCTSTRGLSCSPFMFAQGFEEHAREVAKTLKFKIYKGN